MKKNKPDSDVASLYVGGVFLRDGKPVYIVSGTYYSNGRISNHWGWKRILKGGVLGKLESGYDNEDRFRPFKGTFEIRIILKP